MKKVGYLLIGLALVFSAIYFGLKITGNATFTFPHVFNDTTVPGVFDNLPNTFQGPGVWTTNIEGARKYAKENNRFFIFMLSSPTCGACLTADGAIFTKKSFYDWAKQSKIALVVAPGNNLNSPTTKEFIKLYPDYTGFPAVLLVDETTGINHFGVFWAIVGYPRAGKELLLGPAGFADMINHVVSKYDDMVNGTIMSSNHYVTATSTVLYPNTTLKKNNLYNDYGDNGLSVILNNHDKSKEIVDWYKFANISSGKKYSVKAVDVVDGILKGEILIYKRSWSYSGDYMSLDSRKNVVFNMSPWGKASFYSGINNANNNIPFKEISLIGLSKGYTFTAASNEDIYMKIWAENLTLSQIVEPIYQNKSLNLSNETGDDFNYNIQPEKRRFGLSSLKTTYNLEYVQGDFGFMEGDLVPNTSVSNSYTEVVNNFYEDKPSVGNQIWDFISSFSFWKPSSDKLNISYSGAKSGEWTTDYSSAKELSIENNRPMILLFGKSSNEKYSNDLIKNVLNSLAWKEYAKTKGLPLVILDFSNTSSISREAMRIYPKDNLGEIVKLPTLLYLDSNQEVLGACVYRKGIDCNGIKASVNVTNFVEILESYTGQISDLGFDNASYESYYDESGNYIDCSDGSCSLPATNYTSEDSNAPGAVSDPIVLPGSHIYNTYQDSYGTLKWAEEPIYYQGGNIKILATGAQVGEWTYDWEAAKALSKVNGRPVILWFSGSSCSACASTISGVYSKPEFKQWLRDNKFNIVYVSGDCLDRKHKDYASCNPTLKEFMKLYPAYTGYGVLFLIDGNDYSRAFSIYSTWVGSNLRTLSSGYIEFLTTPSSFAESVDFSINSRDDSLNTSKPYVSPVLLNINSQKKNYNLYNEYSTNSLMWRWDTKHRSQDVVDWYNITGVVSGGKYSLRAINVTDARRMNTNSSSPMLKTASDVRNIGKVSLYSGLDNANNNISFKEMGLNDLSKGYQFTAINNQNVYLKVWREKVNFSKYDTYKSYRDANNISNTSFYDSIEYNLEYYRI